MKMNNKIFTEEAGTYYDLNKYPEPLVLYGYSSKIS